jgi:hypothetical protein
METKFTHIAHHVKNIGTMLAIHHRVSSFVRSVLLVFIDCNQIHFKKLVNTSTRTRFTPQILPTVHGFMSHFDC